MLWTGAHTMARTIHKTDNVTLEGFQAVLEPSKFGYSLAAVVGDLDATEVAELFGTTAGFKTSDPNVTPTTNDEEEDF